MIKLSPERQAEYDALGLPLNTNGVDISDATRFWLTPAGFKFAVVASNSYHELKQTVETLRSAIEYALSHEPCDETDSILEKALKETENL